MQFYFCYFVAYCDDGQNYKNLAQLVKGLGIQYLESTISGNHQYVLFVRV